MVLASKSASLAARRFALFVFLIVIGGLGQLWVTYAYLRCEQCPVQCAALLADGGVFFFATSLTLSSVFLLCQAKRRMDDWALIITIPVLALVCGGAMLAYSSALAHAVASHKPIEVTNRVLMLVSLSVSILYTIYVYIITHQFVDETARTQAQ